MVVHVQRKGICGGKERSRDLLGQAKGSLSEGPVGEGAVRDVSAGDGAASARAKALRRA